MSCLLADKYYLRVNTRLVLKFQLTRLVKIKKLEMLRQKFEPMTVSQFRYLLQAVKSYSVYVLRSAFIERLSYISEWRYYVGSIKECVIARACRFVQNSSVSGLTRLSNAVQLYKQNQASTHFIRERRKSY